MVRSREEAAKRAEASRTNTPGACQKWTRTLFDAPSAGDQDHDGDADAVDGWKSEPRAARHVDRNPPRGVPVAWSGGSHGYGHRAISLGGGKIRSTDAGGSGKVATVDLDWPEKHWGLRWLGWSDTIDGQAIPDGKPTPKSKGLRVVGIDLYHGNPVTQSALNAAVRAGVKFVCLKATEGSSVKDATYHDRLDMVTKAGAIPSAYGFARPDKVTTDEAAKTEGVKEARYFLDYAEPKPGDLRSMLDLEDRNGLGPKLLTAYVDGWVHEYERQVGCLPFIYTHFDLDNNFGCPLWASRYNDDNRLPVIAKPWSNYDLWQFSDGEDGTPKRFAGFKSHAVDLNTIRKGLWLKDYLIPKKQPPPPPPPPTKTLEFRVHLVPGNKVRSAGSIRGDMGIVKQHTHGHSAVVFNTERESAAARKAVSDGLGDGWTRVIDNEDTIAYGSNWTAAGDPYAVLLAKADPSKAGVSPRRYLDVVGLKDNGIGVAMCGTHLVSEANCVHTGVRGRKWREKTWPIQVADVLREVKRVVDSGVPVVLAGDMNTGVFFNGKKLFAELTKRFGDKAVHVHNGGLDQIFLVSTDKVRLSEVGTEVVTDNASDHDMVTALIRAEVIEEKS